MAYLGAIIFDHRPRKVLDRFAFVKDLGDSELALYDFRCCPVASDLIIHICQERAKSRTMILYKVGGNAPVYRRLTRVALNINQLEKYATR